jgi:hypothetical protein
VYFALFGLRVPVRNEAFAAEVAAALGGRKARPHRIAGAHHMLRA